ncbi:hypothetical protein BDN72DRAFT_851950, partial [Pluteus cervinus]
RTRALRRLRNTLPPIASLPNEILSKVFLLCHRLNVNAGPNKTAQKNVEQRGAARLVLSWVSHHWREVAVSYPDLWTFVSKGNLEYMQKCMNRSKNLDLTVNLLDPDAQHIHECFLAMHRIRSLDVDIDPNALEDRIPGGVWQQPAPHLVSSTITNMDLDGPQAAAMFSAVHPRLQHLAVHDWLGFQGWNLPILSTSTLTTLHIIGPDCDIYVSVDTLVAKLQIMTCLEECKLTWCLEDSPQLSLPLHENRQQDKLPSLRTFAIQDSSSSVIFVLLSHLNIPNCSLDLTITAALALQSEDLDEYWTETHYWKDNVLRHVSMDHRSFNRSSAFKTAFSTLPLGIIPQGHSRHFTMTFESDCFADDGSPTVSHYLSLAQCQPRSVFLNSVSRDVVYPFARFTDLR